MIIQAVATYLADNNIGVVGDTIFLGELPLEKDDIISLIYSPSPEPNKAIPYYRQTIDIWVRYSKTETGFAKLKEIQELLHRAENYELDGYHVYLSYSMGMIDDMDRDSENRKLFKLSIAFVYRKALDNIS